MYHMDRGRCGTRHGCPIQCQRASQGQRASPAHTCESQFGSHLDNTPLRKSWICSSTQAKELFAKHNVPTTPGRVTESAANAKAIAEEIGKPVMVKAQVKVGGRGKARRRQVRGHPR